jgi:hypothetical protein
MVSEFLRRQGFDLKKFQALQEQRSVQLEHMIAKHKADALQRASRQKSVHSSIMEQSKALAKLSSQSGFFPNPTFTLDKPFLIWSIPLTDIADSAAVPFGSWAKFDFTTSSTDTSSQKVGFYYNWTNPFTDYAVINAATSFSATGYLKAHAHWALDTNQAFVEAYVLFNVWRGWPDDVISTTSDQAFLGSTGAYGSFGTGGDDVGTSVSAGVTLFDTFFAVPPGAVVVFEVAIHIVYGIDGGNSIEADFNSGDFQIACPVVVFSLLNSPPGEITVTQG